MNLGIEGKLALVVGASKGIGRAVANSLSEEGCLVIGVARSLKDDDRRLGSKLLGSVFPVQMVQMDLMEPGAPDRLAGILREHKESPDIIYHCMGGSWGGVKSWDRPWRDWEQVYRFNLGAAHEINRLLVPAMLERGWGRVVMTSTDGTKNNRGHAPYLSAKCALEGYVMAVGREWAPRGVVLTGVAPGNVYTPGRWTYEQGPEWSEAYWREHVAAGRWAKPDEIARVVVMLCGETAAWMPGSVVRADGGAR